MDLIFDEEVDEVGSDIEAYCPKCRADTTHVVITKYEDEIRRVQCNPCGDVHSYRKPRGELDEEPPEPLAARRRAQAKKPTFDECMAQAKGETPRQYGFRETYAQGEVVDHPKFGLGFVSDLLGDDKLEVTFKDGRRILVHNRKDLPEPPSFAATRREHAAARRPQKDAKRRSAHAPAPSRTSKPARVKAKRPPKPQPSRPAAKPARRPPKAKARPRPPTARRPRAARKVRNLKKGRR